jgi:hypothetical protein
MQPVVQAAAARGRPRRNARLRGPDGRFVPRLVLGVCIVLLTFLSCRSDAKKNESSKLERQKQTAWPRDRREINTASLAIYPKVAREFVLCQNLKFSLYD